MSRSCELKAQQEMHFSLTQKTFIHTHSHAKESYTSAGKNVRLLESLPAGKKYSMT